MAFKASPSSQHQHCTHEAETVLSVYIYIYIYVCMYVCIQMQDTCFQKHYFKNIYDKHYYYAFSTLVSFFVNTRKDIYVSKKGLK